MGECSNYSLPKICEACQSPNIVVRVCWGSGAVRYICQTCGFSRSLPKEENLKKRVNSSMSHWAVQVKKRQPYCQICGNSNLYELEAHHIIPVSHSEEYKYTATNGITLCRKCHFLVHNQV